MKSSWLLVIKYFVISLLSIVQTTHLLRTNTELQYHLCSVYMWSQGYSKSFLTGNGCSVKEKKKVGENSLSFYNSCYWQS